MTMKITTHYKEALTSQMLNYKVETMVGENKVVEGFEVSKNNNSITISPGKCIINGAIIESDEDVNIEVPYSLQDSSDFQVIARYLHSAKSVGFYIYEIDRNLDSNELLLSKSMTDASKMRTLVDLSASLKSIKENLAEDQVLEYENEFITSTDSVEGATTELKIKGQTIVNVAPIKDEVDVYADLQATGNGSVKFNNTGDGIIDGINIKGKTYQNLLQGSWNKTGNMINFHKISTLVKPNTTYTIINNSDDTFHIGVFKNNSAVSSIVGYNKRSPMFKFVTPALDDCDGIRVYIRKFDGSAFTEIDNRYFDVVLIEGDHTNNPDLPSYFEGIIGVGDKSKNLFNIKQITPGALNSDDGIIDASRKDRVTTGFIPVRKGRKIRWNGFVGRGRAFYTTNKEFKKSGTFVDPVFTPEEDGYLRIALDPEELKNNIQIEENSVSTPYEPYYHGNKIEVLSCDDIVTSLLNKSDKTKILLQEPLMSLPNGVCDEIIGNKLIRRVGKINTWDINLWHMGLSSQQFQNTMMFATKEFDSLFVPGGKLICNKFKSYTTWDRDLDACDFTTNNTVRLRIRISRSRLETEDIDGFKKWLQNNEVVIYGELANPIITPIDNDVVMPNGVHDKIIRDKAIRKVRKRILDGTEEWGASRSNPGTSDYVVFYNNKHEPHNFDGFTRGVKGDFLCDGIFEPMDCREDTSLTSSSINGEYITGHFSENIDEIRISILKRRLETLDVAGFKKWLKENPTTIWYELREPYHDTVKTPQLNSYKSQTNIIGSTLIPTPLNIESYGYRKEALIKPNTQYTIHFNNKYADADFKNIKVDLGGAIGNVTANNSLLILKLTTPATLAHNELRISGYGIKVSNVMCSEGSEYREFIDGLAGVGDKSKNLFNGKLFSGWKDTFFEYGIADNIITDFIEVKPGKAYTVSDTRFTYIFGFDKDLNYLGFIQGCTFTNTSYAYVRFGRSVSITNIPNKDFYKELQIEEGTKITSYEHYYDGHKIEILSCGKNLFDYKNNSNYIASYGYGYPYETAGKFADAVSTGRYKDIGNGFWYKTPSNTNNNGLGFYIKCKKNTDYNFNCNASVVGGGYAIKCQGIYASEKPIKSIIEDRNLLINLDKKTNPTVSAVFNSQNYDYLFFYLGGAWVANPTSSVELTLTNIILEENSNFTGYIPYAGDKKQILLQEPLHSLPGGVCDEIIGNKLIRSIGQLVLDGSEDWHIFKTISSNDTIAFAVNGLLSSTNANGNSGNFISDKFKFKDVYANSVNDDGMLVHFNEIRISVLKSRLETRDVAGFKKWLKDNPVTVWYELAMPMKEGYIPQNLNLDTYNETTHVTSNTFVPAIINVKIPTNVGAVIKSDIKRIEAIEDLIDKVMLPQLVESHYKKTLLEFDYEVSRMLK
mgnify:CR=1 FL=1